MPIGATVAEISVTGQLYTGSTRPDCNWTTNFRSQRTSHMEPSATSTTVTGPVGERLQADSEDAPVPARAIETSS